MRIKWLGQLFIPIYLVGDLIYSHLVIPCNIITLEFQPLRGLILVIFAKIFLHINTEFSFMSIDT